MILFLAKMSRLSSDESFHFEILRLLSQAPYSGSDVSELLQAATKIEPGNFESFYTVFYSLAQRIESKAQSIDAAKHPISARDAFFRAATYYRAADFYLHGNPNDPRINDSWNRATAAFDKAIALLPIPGERLTIRTEGFDIPCVYFRASSDPKPRPTLLIHTGFDGSVDEMLHLFGFAALQRGYHVLIFEGPGQASPRRHQGLGFIHDWERVVTPVVDCVFTRPEVDAKRIGLVGTSMGGYMAVRAAAFEHRLAVVVADDGVYDVYAVFRRMFVQATGLSSDTGDEELAAVMERARAEGTLPTAARWAYEQGLWSFNVATGVELLERLKLFTLKGIEELVKGPVWVGCAQADQFFQGQPEMVRDALGGRSHFESLGVEDAAENHCHVGATVLANQRIFDWFEEVIGA